MNNKDSKIKSIDIKQINLDQNRNAGIVENIWKTNKIKFFQIKRTKEKKHQNNFKQNREVLNVSKINSMKKSTQGLRGDQRNQPNQP